MIVRRVSSAQIPVTSYLAAAGVSSGLLMVTWSLALPLWVLGTATILPWLPLFLAEAAATYRRYQWLALFYVLVVAQTGHFFEHVAQVIQIHILGLTGAAAQGIVGALNIEWVHFVWNAWVFAGVLVLVPRYRDNVWLRITLPLTAWHLVEHSYIFLVYRQTGVSGTPGLLSQGGLILGGLPFTRPDLHFIYNLVETIPLLAAFLVQSSRLQAHHSTAASRRVQSRAVIHTRLAMWGSTIAAAGRDTCRQSGHPIAAGRINIASVLPLDTEATNDTWGGPVSLWSDYGDAGGGDRWTGRGEVRERGPATASRRKEENHPPAGVASRPVQSASENAWRTSPSL